MIIIIIIIIILDFFNWKSSSRFRMGLLISWVIQGRLFFAPTLLKRNKLWNASTYRGLQHGAAAFGSPWLGVFTHNFRFMTVIYNTQIFIKNKSKALLFPTQSPQWNLHDHFDR